MLLAIILCRVAEIAHIFLKLGDTALRLFPALACSTSKSNHTRSQIKNCLISLMLSTHCEGADNSKISQTVFVIDNFHQERSRVELS